MLKIFFITFGITILAYNFYIPLPEEVKDPWKIQFGLALKNILHFLISPVTKIGLFTYHDVMRFTHKLVLPAQNPVNDSNINIIETTFDGVEVLMTVPVQNASKPFPALIYLHGGGFALLSARQYLPVTAELTKRLNAIVVSVNYRLAPENPFPIPLQDCITATIHLLKNAANYGIDPLRISISGDSAGGNLAASVVLKLREQKNLPQLKTQVLIYPFMQALDFTLPSYQQNSQFVLSAKGACLFALLYFNEDLALIPALMINNHTSPELKKSKIFSYLDITHLPKKFTETNYVKSNDDFGDIQLSKRLESKFLNGDAFPLMTDNLQGLPPALVLVCQYDVLRDEGLLYAHRLRQAGNKVDEYIVEGGMHGILNIFSFSEMGEEMLNVITKYLNRLM